VKKIDVITRQDENDGTLVMIEIAGYVYARWYKSNPTDEQVKADYEFYGARSRRKVRGEFRPYNQSTGQFTN